VAGTGLEPVTQQLSILLVEHFRRTGTDKNGMVACLSMSQVVRGGVGHDERVWWTHYVQPRRDAQSRREIVAKLTARGLGVRPEVDQEVDHRP
jgi:hypothetical protein